jgi:ABC-type transporter Mla MlaB component
MTASISTSSAVRAVRPTNPVVRCGGAEIRACSRHLATVVTVRGDVTADNLGQVQARIKRFLLCDTPYILDLSELTSIAAEGSALLAAVDDACAATNVEWALVIGWAARALFDREIRDRMLPVAESVAEALHDFADARATRRDLLLPLLHRSA